MMMIPRQNEEATFLRKLAQTAAAAASATTAAATSFFPSI
jgi:hypothetical protein